MVAGVCTVRAQDVHFSQYYASPHTLNPALTGNFQGLIRAGLNYRNQWNSVTIPYQTVSGYTDLNFLRGKLGRGDWFGTGLLLVGDKAGNGELTTTKANFSLAFHKALTREHNFYLSAGGAAYYVQKSIDFTKLTWDNQWNEYGFDSDLDPGENYSRNNLAYLDAHAGLSLLFMEPDKFTIQLGGAMLHINEPKESFYEGSENFVHQRPIAHFNSSFRLSEGFHIQPGMLWMTQRKAQEVIAGTNWAFDIERDRGEPVRFYLGAWYRNKDALIALTGLKMYDTRLLLSYDVNLSKLVPASHGRGAFEISLVYVADSKRQQQRPTFDKKLKFCPHF